jgi:hypothetical protein
VRLVYAGPFSSASIGTDSALEAHLAASAGDKVLYDIRKGPNSYMKTIESGGTRTSPAQKVISFCNYPASLLYSSTAADRLEHHACFFHIASSVVDTLEPVYGDRRDKCHHGRCFSRSPNYILEIAAGLQTYDSPM